jgi:YegS/Rv2252/BmrU family lipid kinase
VKIAAIINPVSGAGADTATASRRVAMLTGHLSRRGLHAAIALTERAGHAYELASAAAADLVDLVIVWGGDGTINETGAALMGTQTAIGIVPAGSGNGLARALGVSRDPSTAITGALDGRVSAIDAGVIAGRPFFNIAGIGVDARIARLFNERAKGSRGGAPYIVIGVREGFTYRGREYAIELDGRRLTTRALLIAFANGQQYGMGAQIAPEARVDDGLLDVVVVEDRSVFARFWHARHLATGSAHRAPRVLTHRTSRAIVHADAEVEYHVDGELGRAGTAVEVEVRPAALRVRGRRTES